MITITEPQTWKELQVKTAEILSECGLVVEIEKKTESVRGTIEIDVYAKEIIQTRENIIIAECKYWNKPIPQTVIHAFRTVVTDVGGNIGYIISKVGFQSGSYIAASFSNIKLLTWQDFMTLFEEQWYVNFFCEYIEEHFDSLMTYTEPLVPNWAMKLEGRDVERMKELRKEHEGLGVLLLMLTKYPRFFSKEKREELPLINKFKEINIPEEILYIQGYKDLIPILHKYCNPAIDQFHELKSKVI